MEREFNTCEFSSEKTGEYLEPEEACRLAVLARSGDQKALEDVIRLARPYIVKSIQRFLERYTKNDHDLDEFILLGQEGLRKFIFSKNTFFDRIGPDNVKNRENFFLVAYPWIVKDVRDALTQEGPVPVSSYDRSNLFLLNKIVQEYRTKNNGEMPDIDYLAKRLGFVKDGRNRVLHLFGLLNRNRLVYFGDSAFKGNHSESGEGKLTVSDTFSSGNEKDPEELVSKKEFLDKIRDHFLGLDFMIAMDILKKICGLGGSQKKTVNEVAEEFNITPQEVTKILKKARSLYIIESVYGLGGRVDSSYDEVGKELGVSRQRVEQILKEVAPALKRLLKGYE